MPSQFEFRRVNSPEIMNLLMTGGNRKYNFQYSGIVEEYVTAAGKAVGPAAYRSKEGDKVLLVFTDQTGGDYCIVDDDPDYPHVVEDFKREFGHSEQRLEIATVQHFVKAPGDVPVADERLLVSDVTFDIAPEEGNPNNWFYSCEQVGGVDDFTSIFNLDSGFIRNPMVSWRELYLGFQPPAKKVKHLNCLVRLDASGGAAAHLNLRIVTEADAFNTHTPIHNVGLMSNIFGSTTIQQTGWLDCSTRNIGPTNGPKIRCGFVNPNAGSTVQIYELWLYVVHDLEE